MHTFDYKHYDCAGNRLHINDVVIIDGHPDMKYVIIDMYNGEAILRDKNSTLRRTETDYYLLRIGKLQECVKCEDGTICLI